MQETGLLPGADGLDDLKSPSAENPRLLTVGVPHNVQRTELRDNLHATWLCTGSLPSGPEFGPQPDALRPLVGREGGWGGHSAGPQGEGRSVHPPSCYSMWGKYLAEGHPFLPIFSQASLSDASRLKTLRRDVFFSLPLPVGLGEEPGEALARPMRHAGRRRAAKAGEARPDHALNLQKLQGRRWRRCQHHVCGEKRLKRHWISQV